MPVMPEDALPLPRLPIQRLLNGKARSVASALNDSLPAGGAVRRTASEQPPPVRPAAPTPAARVPREPQAAARRPPPPPARVAAPAPAPAAPFVPAKAPTPAAPTPAV